MVGSALAHDPYEITTRAYLYSNHLELRIEMEFAAALLVSQSNGARPNVSTAADRFAYALPNLQARAPDFLRVTGNGELLPVTRTNVSLGAEDHVRFVLELPITERRTLRFAVGGLKALSAHGNYGTSLTVVDMVRNHVLGQAVLFGDSPPLQLRTSDAPRLETNDATIHVPAENLPRSAKNAPQNTNSRYLPITLILLVLLGALAVGLYVWRQRANS
jgi:hypothetical protein